MNIQLRELIKEYYPVVSNSEIIETDIQEVKDLIKNVVLLCAETAKTKEVQIPYDGIIDGGSYTKTIIDQESILNLIL